jgi:methionyl-tRNA synthetase
VNDESYQKWWPAEYHLIGKDILTTHAVYWPTMLMSAEMPLPKSIFAHGWWMSGESKMSKTLGNVVNPLDLIEEYGVDPVRYYLMREMVLGQDASFRMESFIKRYNSDLANDFGNLLSRISKLIEKNFDSIVPDPGKSTPADNEIKVSAEKVITSIHILITEMKVHEAIEETLQFIRGVNKYMEHQAPWKLVKNDKEAAGRVLYTAAEALRIGTLLLGPVMPHRTEIVLETFDVQTSELSWGGLKAGTRLKQHPPLFPRIDMQKGNSEDNTNTHGTFIDYEDFEKLGLKTAEILSAEKVEGTDKLYKLQIKAGNEEWQIVSGIADHYTPEELVGKTIIVVSNLEQATIQGVKSKGMLLSASRKKELSLIVVDGDKVESGGKVY